MSRVRAFFNIAGYVNFGAMMAGGTWSYVFYVTKPPGLHDSIDDALGAFCYGMIKPYQLAYNAFPSTMTYDDVYERERNETRA